MSEEAVKFQQFVRIEENLLREVMDLKETVESSERIVTGIGFDEALNFHDTLCAYHIASQDGRLIGVATIFAPSHDEGEIAVCVDPLFRKKGIGRRLVAASIAELERFGTTKAMLVCDGKSESGKHFVDALGGSLLFSEFGMRLDRLVPAPVLSRLDVTHAQKHDAEAMAVLCARAYGDSLTESRSFIDTCMIAVQRTGYIGYLKQMPVALCFVSTHEDAISVNTVAVDPVYQHQGVGSAFLTVILSSLEDGTKPIVLDVNSTNSRAFGLYRKLGFKVVSDIGYYLVDGSAETIRLDEEF